MNTDQQHETQLAYRMVWLVVGVMLFLTALQVAFFTLQWIWVLPTALTLLVLLGVHLRCQNFRPYWLSLTALTGLWVTVGIYSHLLGGLSSPVLLGWPLVVVGFSVLLGMRQGQVVLGISLLTGFMLANHPVSDPPFSRTHSELVLVVYTLTFYLMGLSILSMHRRSVRQIQAQQVQHLKIQQAMEITEARNQAILDALPDVVFRVTQDTTIQDVNIGEQVGWPIKPENWLGHKVTQYLQDHDAQDVLDRLSWVLSGDGMQTQELTLDHPQLGKRTLESRMVAISEQHAILFWRDISERKKVELEGQARLRRMEVMDRFSLALADSNLNGTLLLQAVADHGALLLGGKCTVTVWHLGDPADVPLEEFSAGTAQQAVQKLEIPLNFHGTQQGTVRLDRSTLDPFSTEEQAMMHTLVERAGLVFTNTQLNLQNRDQAEQLRRANEELEARIEARTQELAQANSRLQELTIRDGLTGIFNRRHFDERLEQEVRRLQRSDQPLTLMLCDIDFFKKYNDHYGHPQGDVCLKKVAEVLSGTFQRAGDVVARYGGEEFAMVLPNTSLVQARQLAERLCQKMTQLGLLHEFSEVAGHITLSVGVVAASRCDQVTASVLLQTADEALYHSKHTGRNRATLRALMAEGSGLKVSAME
ncbi:sensor domain-containing diguanylate cyclase [Deinococcus roseus]|uniref:GGDEF domain-containing protein n=1 Tax=Deinococcus roseus TaxID=392414 RepID=A0ABQ2D647_9DEIO|nr:GGDEF domain-containing protein [Deinococcus roseus]GGJ46795.1 hypothetical protein GCM10008938_36200 [Deinococcus roseus]